MQSRLNPLAATLALALVSGFFTQSAQAYEVTLEQVGPDVVATGSGAIDLTGLTLLFAGGTVSGGLTPYHAGIGTGSPSDESVDFYTGITGPSSFGTSKDEPATSGGGDPVAIDGNSRNVFVPAGYMSGDALSDSSTYAGATFASLGVIPGTYEWTWGAGANQNFTVEIGTVPDSGSTVGLFFLALVALVGASRVRYLRSA